MGDVMTEERIRDIVREEITRATTLPELLDVKRAAERLSVSRGQVYRLLDQRAMDSVYLGRRRLVHADSLRRFVAALPGLPALEPGDKEPPPAKWAPGVAPVST
jgi:excisionase family DNA binding protein